MGATVIELMDRVRDEADFSKPAPVPHGTLVVASEKRNWAPFANKTIVLTSSTASAANRVPQ